MTLQDENKLNAVGDELAHMLFMSVDREASPDSQGRTRWRTTVGNKTGLGLMRTIERFVGDKVEETKPRRKA